MHRNAYIVLFVLLFSLAGFFATFHLTESPPVWYDEGFYVQSAANLAEYGHTGLRVSPDTIEPSSKLITVGYPLIYPLAGWMHLFGTSILSARSLMVLFILGLTLASFLFVRRLYGNWAALGALALLVTLPTLYGNGKTVLGEVPGLLYLVLFLLVFSFAKSVSTQRYAWWTLAGLMAGLCVATKPTYLVLLPAILAGVCVALREKTISIKDIVVAAIAGMVPLLVWVFLQFRGGDSLIETLSYYANPYQLADLPSVILANAASLVAGVGPLYLLGSMGIWIAAVCIRVYRRERISAEEVIALTFSLLIIAAYLRTAGWYRYLFEAQVVSLFFLPYALKVCVGTCLKYAQARTMATVVVAGLVLFGAYQTMFSSFVAESYHREKTAFLENYFKNTSPDDSFFFYNVPEAAIFISGTNYYQYINASGWYIGKEQLPILDRGGVDTVILAADMYEHLKNDFSSLYTVTQATHDYVMLEKL